MLLKNIFRILHQQLLMLKEVNIDIVKKYKRKLDNNNLKTMII